MKANRKILKNDSGDVGVGTLIIFISMVLVAAVAAAVLIYTTGALQQKATKTSKEATQQISSNIIVDKVIGDRGSPVNATQIESLLIRIKPDVGTTSIDLRQVIVTVMDKDYRYDLKYSSNYTASAVRDEDSSFTTSTPVLNSGDLVEISVNDTALGLGSITLSTRKTFWLALNQELGQAINLEITTPNSYGVNRYVQLYP